MTCRAARMNGKPMDLSHHVIKKAEREEDKIPQLGVKDLFDSELWMMTVSMEMMVVSMEMMMMGVAMMMVGMAMMVVGMEIMTMSMMTIGDGVIMLCQILTVTSSLQ